MTVIQNRVVHSAGDRLTVGPLDSPKLLMVTTVAGTLKAFLLPLAHNFRCKGWRVDALAQGASSCDDCRSAFDHVWDAKWTRNPIDVSNLRAMLRDVRALVAREKYDIVHVHTPVAAFVTRAALRRFRKTGRPSVIYTAHGFHFYRGGPRLRNAVFRRLEQVAGAWTDFLIVINQEDEDAARRLRFVPDANLFHVPGVGIDAGRYGAAAISQTQVLEVRAELGLTSQDQLFVMVAEFIPRKRHVDALEAFARMQRKKVHLAFAGDGPLIGRLRERAALLGVADRVHFLGNRRDVPALLRAANASVLPSRQEGLPRVVMESLCLGVPVIATDIRGARDLLPEGRGGLIVKPGDVEGFASAMRWILDHPVEAASMGQQGQEAMRAYDVTRVIAAHDQIYRRALSTNRRDPYISRLLRPGAAPGRYMKRAIDVLGALIGLVLNAPVLAVVAAAIRFTMGAPVFFRQDRPGLGARSFRLIKFRTMRTAATPDGQPLSDADRITPLGRFLRRTSIDELPELWNVLRGDMSLVGPRPLLVKYLPLYSPEQARRHNVRPGITGWAQVNGRNTLSWKDKLALDVWYVDHQSLWLDLKIIGLTLWKVVRREGISQPGHATMEEFLG